MCCISTFEHLHQPSGNLLHGDGFPLCHPTSGEEQRNVTFIPKAHSPQQKELQSATQTQKMKTQLIIIMQSRNLNGLHDLEQRIDLRPNAILGQTTPLQLT